MLYHEQRDIDIINRVEHGQTEKVRIYKQWTNKRGLENGQNGLLMGKDTVCCAVHKVNNAPVNPVVFKKCKKRTGTLCTAQYTNIQRGN